MVSGAGGVGSWAVQLAKAHYKVYVVATAGPKNQQFLKELGADETGGLDLCLDEEFTSALAAAAAAWVAALVACVTLACAQWTIRRMTLRRGTRTLPLM